MLILTIRTDKPEAEIVLYEDSQQLAYQSWPAHRELAESLHIKIQELLKGQMKKLYDIQGVACYQGPGSFTGLRIGLTVGNALAYALEVPIVAETGDNWQEQAISRLATGDADPLALPEYGAEANITRPKH